MAENNSIRLPGILVGTYDQRKYGFGVAVSTFLSTVLWDRIAEPKVALLCSSGVLIALAGQVVIDVVGKWKGTYDA